jgi:hypothetical protein
MEGPTFRKLARLAPRDWWYLLLGQAAILRAKRDLKVRPRGELVGAHSTDPGVMVSEQTDQARRVALGVTRAAAYGVTYATCLVRSLAICRRLEAEGISGGRIRVGVAKRRGKFLAHAWVDYHGVILGDDHDNVDTYTVLPDLHVNALP